MLAVRRRLLLASLRRSYATPSASVATYTTETASPAKKRTRKPKQPKQPKELPKTTLDHSVVHEHLRHIASLQANPTVEDLDACHPEKHSRPDSEKYDEEYTSLLEDVLRRFSAAQLRHFTVDVFRFGIPRSRDKTTHARAIIEHHWGWPSLSEVQEQRRLWTVHSSTEIPVTPREFFFALGQDGIGLRNLSNEFDVHVSPVLTTSSRVKGLLVEGVQGSIDNVTARISEIKKDIAETQFELPPSTDLSSALLLRISRLSGALTDQDRPGWLRISYLQSKPEAAETAKRLSIRAAKISSSHPPLHSYMPVGIKPNSTIPSAMAPHAYSLFPFFTSGSLPWTLPSASLFRARRVGEWLGTRTSEDIRRTGGLAGGRGTVLSPSSDEVNLRDILLQSLGGLRLPSGHISATATSGHLVNVINYTTRPSILPPLPGSWQISRLFQWLEESSPNQAFIPSLSQRVFSSSPIEQTLTRRLEYRGTSNEALKLEIVLPKLHEAEGPVEHLEYHCSAGKQADVHLMLGDRPMDARLTVSSMQDIPDTAWPPPLVQYVNDLRSYLSLRDPSAPPPDAPYVLCLDGVTYGLYSNANVRRSVDVIPSNVDEDGQVVSESLLDIDTEEKVSQCQVICSDITANGNWRRFLGHCDWLTTLPIDDTAEDPFKDMHTLGQEAGLDASQKF